MSAALAWCHADLGFAPALVADAGRGLCLLVIGSERGEDSLASWRARHALDLPVRACSAEPPPRLEAARRQLEDYARGRLRSFDLELDLRGTDFERAVWSALLAIPFGELVTYGQLARALGRPGGARAVGGAAGRNPVPIVVPCHRLVASTGLGGFTGGLDHKRALLALEGHALERPPAREVKSAAMSPCTWSLRRLHALDDAQIGALAELLIDCVEGDASVSFMHPLTRERAVAFWSRVGRGVAAGERALLVAEDAQGVCGTVQLLLDQPENQPHRADLAKMLVHRRARRRGLGAALMGAAEAMARECGKTLLVLDAVSGGDAARLYERLGWVRVGEIPGYALMPRGGLCATTVYYRQLGG